MNDSPTPAARRRAELRERLIDAAEAAIVAKGLSGLKARDIAAQAGCAVGAIYTAFEDLDELVLRVNERTLGRLEQALPAAAGDTGLRDLATAYLAFARAEEPRWRALFEHRLPQGKDVPDWYASARQSLFTRLEAPLAEIAPAADRAQTALLAKTLFSAVHGVVALGMEEKIGPTSAAALEAQVDTLARLLAVGLASRPAT